MLEKPAKFYNIRRKELYELLQKCTAKEVEEFKSRYVDVFTIKTVDIPHVMHSLNRRVKFRETKEARYREQVIKRQCLTVVQQ